MNSYNFTKNQRWYDKNPTLSLAVSFMYNAPAEKQREIAEIIIEKAISMGVEINEIKILLKRRWFDKDDRLSAAMEYLRQASAENQKIIALDIINFLTEIKA